MSKHVLDSSLDSKENSVGRWWYRCRRQRGYRWCRSQLGICSPPRIHPGSKGEKFDFPCRRLQRTIPGNSEDLQVRKHCRQCTQDRNRPPRRSTGCQREYWLMKSHTFPNLSPRLFPAQKQGSARAAPEASPTPLTSASRGYDEAKRYPEFEARFQRLSYICEVGHTRAPYPAKANEFRFSFALLNVVTYLVRRHQASDCDHHSYRSVPPSAAPLATSTSKSPWGCLSVHDRLLTVGCRPRQNCRLLWSEDGHGSGRASSPRDLRQSRKERSHDRSVLWCVCRLQAVGGAREGSTRGGAGDRGRWGTRWGRGGRPGANGRR